jgi:hypothetical protein
MRVVVWDAVRVEARVAAREEAWVKARVAAVFWEGIGGIDAPSITGWGNAFNHLN